MKLKLFRIIAAAAVLVSGTAAALLWNSWQQLNGLIHSPEFIDRASASVLEAYDLMQREQLQLGRLRASAVIFAVSIALLVISILWTRRRIPAPRQSPPPPV